VHLHHIRGKNVTPVSFKGVAQTDPYKLPCKIPYLQKAQLSQRSRKMLRVIENYSQGHAKLLHWVRGVQVPLVFDCNYGTSLFVPFLRRLMSNNGKPLQSKLRVDHPVNLCTIWTLRKSTAIYFATASIGTNWHTISDLLLVFHCNYILSFLR